MKYSFHEEEMLLTYLGTDDECPQCPDEEILKPAIHFDTETVEILMVDKYETGG